MGTCETCKFHINGICTHDEFKNDYIESLCCYIEWRFDGDIQSKLNEVIDNKVNLTDNEKESLIEDICNCIVNDLTDASNIKDGELQTDFMPTFGFSCKHYE